MRAAAPDPVAELAVTLRHFFPEMDRWLDEVHDPRKSGKSEYRMRVLLLMGTLMFLGHTKSRNHMNDNVRGASAMAGNLARLSGEEVADVPHLDTLEKVLRRSDPAHIERVLSFMIRRLVRMKALDGWRMGSRFPLAVDGTGLYSFAERHCENCIETRHASGAVTYSHKLLVAYIVSDEGYALPVACEFIENPGAVYVKQDCEIQAFRRLEERLRRLYAGLSFHLLLDAMYADKGVMGMCLRNGWNFSITFKPSDMPALWDEGQRLLALAPGQTRTVMLPQDQGVRIIRWVNDLDYHGMRLSAIFQEDKAGDGSPVRTFAHLTGREIDTGKAQAAAHVARQRWRCENEGFNVLKNGGFALEHVYSRNPVAAKAYVGLLLIAHLLQPLVTRGRVGAVFREAFHTFLNYGKRMIESLRLHAIPEHLPMPGQIRLSTA